MVIDASVAIAWSIPTQQTGSASAFLAEQSGGDLIAPWCFGLEIRNALLKAERRKLTSAEASAASVSDLLRLVSLIPPPPTDHLDAIQDLARGERLSHCDAQYLDLALARGAALASRDGALLEAAARLGVDAVDLRG